MFNAAPIYPMAAAAEIFPKWVAWTRTAPEEATSRALFWTFPDVDALPPELRGQDALILAALYSGSPDEGERVLQPLREMGAPLFDLSMALPYRAAQSNFDPFFAKGVTRSYWKSLYLDDLDDAACELIVRRAMDRPHPLTLVHVPQMGGATSRIAADDSAFGDRSAAYMLSVDGNWIDAADDAAAIAWTRGFIAEAAQLPSARGIYLNFSGDEEIDGDLRAAAFGANLARLTQVKDQFDPGNLFRLNNNIPPSRTIDLPGQRITVASEKAGSS